MNENTISELKDIGFTFSQLSQLIKIAELGIKENTFLDSYYSDKLVLMNTDKLKEFRNILLNLDKKINKMDLLDYFVKYEDCVDIIKKSPNANRALFILSHRNFIEKDDVDIFYIDNNNYDEETILEDLKINRTAVKKYLTNNVSKKHSNLFRLGLLMNIDLTSYIEKFSWLEDGDVDNLKIIVEKGYDADGALKKMKNTELALYILEKKAKGIDCLAYVNRNMSKEVIDYICERIEVNNLDFIKKIKTFDLKSLDDIELLEKIDKYDYPVKLCKNIGVNTLQSILYSLESGIDCNTTTDIMNTSFVGAIRRVLIECYKTNNLDLANFIKEYEDKLLFVVLKDEDVAEKLFTYSIKNNLDIINLFIEKDTNIFVGQDKYEIIAKNIIDGKVDNDLLLMLNNNSYDANKCELIIKAKNEGYDYKLFTQDLSFSDMNAILNCLRLGFKMEKPEKYETEKTNYNDVTKKYYRKYNDVLMVETFDGNSNFYYY